MNFKRVMWLASGAPLFAACGPPPGTGCGLLATVQWDGGVVDGGSVTGNALDWATCASICPPPTSECVVTDGGLVECSHYCIGGRLPAGMVTLAEVDGSAGSWLARMAELEAAAVHAFLNLAQELDAHGLPRFAEHALTAAGHELTHARRTAGLSLRFGIAPRAPTVAASEVRSLEALAIDNAGEGCGRELFGALLNAHQATTASDPHVAAVMRDIAVDELQHAELSFALSEALLPRLSLAQRRRAREAQAQVLETLAADDAPAHTRATLGLMDSAQARATAHRLLATRRV